MNEEEIKIEFDELFTQIGDIYGLCSLYNNIVLVSPAKTQKKWSMIHYINPEEENSVFIVNEIPFDSLDDAKIGTYDYLMSSSFFGERTLKILKIVYPQAGASSPQKYKLMRIDPKKYPNKKSLELMTKIEAKNIIEYHALQQFIKKLTSNGLGLCV